MRSGMGQSHTNMLKSKQTMKAIEEQNLELSDSEAQQKREDEDLGRSGENIDLTDYDVQSKGSARKGMKPILS